MRAFYALSAVLLLYVLVPVLVLFASFRLNAAEEVLSNSYLSSALLNSIEVTLIASFASVLILIIFGTPLAYLLARSESKLKHAVQSVVDLPMALPHSVVGIMLLLAFQDTPLGNLLRSIGISIVDNVWGTVAVMTFVGLPFYINGLRDGIESVPESLEMVARSLGASKYQTFFKIVLPSVKRSLVVASLLAWARGISEIGALLIIAYNPMTLSVLVYEWYKTLGLNYAIVASTVLALIAIVVFAIVQRLREGPS